MKVSNCLSKINDLFVACWPKSTVNQQALADIERRYSDKECFRLVYSHYGESISAATNKRFIDAIFEGIRIGEYLEYSRDAIDAFCLIDIVYPDYNLKYHRPKLSRLDPKIVLIAMEYRHIAKSHADMCGVFKPSVISEANEVLVMDVVRSKKDFIDNYYGAGDLSKNEQEQDQTIYDGFNNRLKALGISQKEYDKLVSLIL